MEEKETTEGGKLAIKVEIINPRTAKSLNEHKRPDPSDYPEPECAVAYYLAFDQWEGAEENRVEYRILNWLTDGWQPSYNDPDNSGCKEPAEPQYYGCEGAIRVAEVDDKKKTCVIL